MHPVGTKIKGGGSHSDRSFRSGPVGRPTVEPIFSEIQGSTRQPTFEVITFTTLKK